MVDRTTDYEVNAVKSKFQFIAIGKCLFYRADLTAKAAVENLLRHARDVQGIKVFKVPAKSPGTFEEDGTWRPVEGESIPVTVPKRPKFITISVVANQQREPIKLPEGQSHGFLATGRGLAFFCGETASEALERFENFTRSVEEVVLW